MATTKVLLGFPWSKSKDSDLKPLKEKVVASDSVMKVARKELREDKTTREQSLVQMRDWLKKNSEIENVRTDDSFLLRFLRNKKFSVPMAQQQLLKYLNMRKVMGHLSYNLDYLSPGVKALIENGYILPSPIRDSYGRRTVLYFASEWFNLCFWIQHLFLIFQTAWTFRMAYNTPKLIKLRPIGSSTRLSWHRPRNKYLESSISETFRGRIPRMLVCGRIPSNFWSFWNGANSRCLCDTRKFTSTMWLRC